MVDIENQKLFRIFGAPMIFSLIVGVKYDTDCTLIIS